MLLVSKNIYTAQKKHHHYAPQPYTNQSVFKSLLNCSSEMARSRNVTGREFQRDQRRKKLLSPRRVRVLFVEQVKTSVDRSDRRPMSVKSWQSSARYCGSWPCNALYTRTAILKSIRCRTGNHCSSRRTGVICCRLPVRMISLFCTDYVSAIANFRSKFDCVLADIAK